MFPYSLIIAQSLTFLRVSLLAKLGGKSTVFCSSQFHSVIRFVLNFVIKHFSDIKVLYDWFTIHTWSKFNFSHFFLQKSPPFKKILSLFLDSHLLLLAGITCWAHWALSSSTVPVSVLPLVLKSLTPEQSSFDCWGYSIGSIPNVHRSLNGILIHLFTIHSSNV